MKMLHFLVLLPRKIALHFEWAGFVIARITVGYVFMLTGWGKLQHLDQVTEYFGSLSIPAPHLLAPFVSGIEWVGGLFLMLGFLTRIMGGALAITMMVAILSAKLAEIDSLHTLLGFEETLFFVIFSWLAISGAGKASVDYLIERKSVSAPVNL